MRVATAPALSLLRILSKQGSLVFAPDQVTRYQPLSPSLVNTARSADLCVSWLLVAAFFLEIRSHSDGTFQGPQIREAHITGISGIPKRCYLDSLKSLKSERDPRQWGSLF